MIRKIIRIDESKCNGCGVCADTCHEGAIGMVNGKAKLLRDDYCDGLGDCLPACPTKAITFVEREAAAYDKAAVHASPAASQLLQWPVQIRLMPAAAPYYNGADLLIAADCTAYAYGNFHNEFIKNHVTVIGCPKLDNADHTEKLTAILQANDIRSVTLTRMEVPCCGGLEQAARTAILAVGKDTPFRTVVISTDGQVL